MSSNNSWQKVRFDQICKNISSRIDDPKQADTDYYVGLEHLDSEEPRILRHGSPNDVNATKLKFKSGQILFGKRRWYQRKLAIAKRDGICSAHMMVLESFGNKIIKDFLPILMQSEDFFEKALRVSAGSLSPTIKWKDIAKEEFLIPSISDQEFLSSLINQIDDSISKSQNLVEKTKNYNNSRRNDLLTRGIGHTKFKKVKWYFGKEIKIPEEWKVTILSKCGDIVSGTAFPHKYQGKTDCEFPFFKVDDTNLPENAVYMNKSPNTITKKDVELLKAKIVHKDSIIFPKIGATLFKNKRRIIIKPSAFDNNMAAFVPKQNFPKFMYYWLSIIDFTEIVNPGPIPSISDSTLKKLKVISPSYEEQKQIVSLLSKLDEQLQQLESHLSILKTMRKSILNLKLIPKEKMIVTN